MSGTGTLGSPLTRCSRLSVECAWRVSTKSRTAAEPTRPSPEGVCLNGRVQAQIEELPENRVRLTVQVPSHDVHHAVEHAATDLAADREDPGLPQGQGPAPGARAEGRQGAPDDRGDREPHRRLVLERRRADARAADRAARVRVRAPDGRRRGLGVQRDLPRAGEAGAAGLDDARGRRDRARGSGGARAAGARRAPLDGRGARPGRRAARSARTTRWSSTSISPGGETRRDYVVELGRGAVVDEVEQGVVGLNAGETKQIEFELADDSKQIGRCDRQGDQGEGAARARRRACALSERVRHARRAARRHRVAPSRARSPRRSRRSSAPTSSMRSSPRRRWTHRGRSSRRARASCCAGSRGRSRRAAFRSRRTSR